MDKKCLTEIEAAEYLGLSRASLRQSRMNRFRQNRLNSPPYVRLGRSIRYLREDLDRWLASHRVDQLGGAK